MQNSILVGLIQNTALLLAFAMLYDYAWLKNETPHKLNYKLLTGLFIGISTIILMSTPWVLAPGIAFDSRSIILSITGLFFGFIPTLIAITVATLYRVFLGGDGMYMGIAVIITSGIIGLIWNKLNPNWSSSKNKAIHLLIMGLTVHIVMLACTVFLPSASFLTTIKTIALPLLIIYAPGTMLLGLLMIKQLQNWENRQAKDRLLESEQWFTEMLKNMNLLSIIIDKNGYITFANPYFLDKTGYIDLELIGTNWLSTFIPKRDQHQMEQVFNEIIRNNQNPLNYENEIIIKNGTKLLVSWNNTLLRDQLGQIIGTASIGEIIHEQKLLERKKLQFATILESSLNEIYIFNASSLYYRYVNYGALKNLGYTLEQVKMLTPLDIMKDFTEESFLEFTKPLRDESEKILVFETTHIRINGSHYPVEVHLQVFTDANDIIYLAVVQDVSERKVYEKQLIDAKLKAEESDKLKTIFLANLSHEIRTPLNSIVGFTHLLLQTDVILEKKTRFQDIIYQSINKLLSMINNLVDMSKIESNAIAIHKEPTDLNSLFNESLIHFNSKEYLILKPQLSIKLIIDAANSPQFIVADPIRIKQVLHNLLFNAIKYTESGKIEFGYNIIQTINEPQVKIFVHDTGIGIPDDKKDLVFSRFRQIEEEQFHEGAGLGLSIAKGIVELMGGKIWFDSELGKGSSFYFTIPLELHQEIKLKKVEQSIEPQTPLKDKKVLIVEDDYNSFLYLNEILKTAGMQIKHAKNGIEAVNLTFDFNPEIILMDINIPLKNGIDCTREIKEKGHPSKIIIQSAYTETFDPSKYQQIGCDSYLLKPVKKDDLLLTIKNII
jgi:PAS domain S-box-containing protein